MNSLNYQNYALLVCNNGLSTTCCNTPSGVLFWDAAPCDNARNYRVGCNEVDQCLLSQREYISHKSMCAGDVNIICEAQRLKINNWNKIHSLFTDAITVGLVSGTGRIIWNNDNIHILDDLGLDYNISTTGSLTNIINIIDGLPNWTASMGPDAVDGDLIGKIIATGQYDYDSAISQTFATKPSQFSLILDNVEATGILYNSNANILANNIANAFVTQSIPIFCVANTGLEYDANQYKYFDIVFQSGLCGYPQSEIHVGDMLLSYEDGYYDGIANGTVTGIYGKYKEGWYLDARVDLLSTDYVVIGSGYGAPCPYEALNLDESDTVAEGPYPFDNTQCCPQKGCIIGPNQVLTSGSNGYSGYFKRDDLSNLENTVILNGSCYNVSPFYFIFGKEGRFNKDQLSTRSPYIECDCDYRQPVESGGCGGTTPTNCSLELFLPQFHQNVPWGPFGSYYPNIESAQHKAIDYLDSYIYNNFISISDNRRGFYYRPRGHILTRGTWRETLEIEVSGQVHRPGAFYVGSGILDDNQLFAEIDASSVSPFLSGYLGNGCDGFRFIFNTSGRIVGDFVDAINALRIKEYDRTQGGCQVFAFCLSSQDVRDLPASIITNVSTEMYDIAKQHGSYDESQGSYNPLIDKVADNGGNRLFSGSDIYPKPKAYQDLWPETDKGNPETNNLTIPEQFTTTYGSFTNALKLPPLCRHRLNTLPKQSNTDFRSGSTTFPQNASLYIPWWRSMEGKRETVINISKNNEVPFYVDQLKVSVDNRIINYSVYVSGILAVTGSLNTNKNGYDYTTASGVNDLNNITITTAGDNYHIFTATSGNQLFNVWLDDNKTYWKPGSDYIPCNSGDVGAALTPIDFSYYEPIINHSVVNIINTDMEIQSWVRRRCAWRNNDSEPRNHLPLSGCVPAESTRYFDNERINCDGDMIIENNYLVTYGCAGNFCKTEWFYKAKRCECDNHWDCATRSYLPHLFNREGDDLINAEQHNGYAVNQPTLYICEQDIHNQCDIPFLIKVPFQIIGPSGSLPLESSRFNRCANSQYDIFYVDDQIDSVIEALAGISLVSCTRSHTPALYQIPTRPFESDCVGWCQYFDPVSAERVQRHNIPKTWPPKSYIVEKGDPLYCSVNPYGDDISEICSPTLPPSFNWDSLRNILPVVPPEYINSDTGKPCMFTGADNGLTVYTRPILNPLTAGELCNSLNNTRIDINCATKCCECFFSCNDSDGSDTGDLVRCPCIFSITYNDVIIDDQVYLCSFSNENNTIQPCNTCCLAPNSVAVWPQQIGGTYTTTATITISATIDTCCGCREEDFSGVIEYDYSKNATCGGDNGLIHFFDQCGGSPGPGFPCYVGTPFCDAPPDQILDCSYLNELSVPGNSSYDESGIGVRQPFDFWCNFCSTMSDYHIYGNSTYDSTLCGGESSNWDFTIETIMAGTSAFDGATLGIWGQGPLDRNEFTLVYNRSGSYEKTEPECSSCPVDQQRSKDLPYVTGWLSRAEWLCGTSNSIVATGIIGYIPHCSGA